MSTQQEELAEAAAGLTVQDFRYLEENDMLPEKEADSEKPAQPQEASSEKTASQEDSSQKGSGTNKGKRRKVNHQWPEVGAVLQADYKGTHYEAEVISMPRYKSGKAIRILTGPAEGEVERSMSGAMLTATEKQREENDLGRKGVANGWDFWKVKQGGRKE